MLELELFELLPDEDAVELALVFAGAGGDPDDDDDDDVAALVGAVGVSIFSTNEVLASSLIGFTATAMGDDAFGITVATGAIGDFSGAVAIIILHVCSGLTDADFVCSNVSNLSIRPLRRDELVLLMSGVS